MAAPSLGQRHRQRNSKESTLHGLQNKQRLAFAALTLSVQGKAEQSHLRVQATAQLREAWEATCSCVEPRQRHAACMLLQSSYACLV